MSVQCATYLRQSLDVAQTGLAIDRQRAACQKFAEARGWTVVAEYAENSTSATAGTRKQFEQMLVDANRGRFEVIVAWALDRLTRSVYDMERLVQLSERHGVRVATASGDLDLTTDQGRLVGRILTAVARGEVERKAERQKLAHAQRAEQGRPPTGGYRAFGYQRDGMTPIPREAELVQQAFDIVLGGGSVRSVVRLFNDAGATTATGRPWQPHSARDLLLNPRYAGLSAIRGAIVGPGQWPALVAEETWRAVNAILTDPSRRTTIAGDVARKYLLTGLAQCGQCSELVIAGGRSTRGAKTYRCASRRHFIRRIDPIDHHVENIIVARLNRPDVADLFDQDAAVEAARLQTEAVALRARRDQLAEAFAAGEIGRSQLAAGTKRIDYWLSEIGLTLAGAARTTAVKPFIGTGDAQDVWDRLDLDRRRAVIAELADVVILPAGQGAKQFDPSTVQVTPRSTNPRPAA